MSNEGLREFIVKQIPEAEFEENAKFLIAVISAEKLRSLSETLKANPETQFDFLFCQTGADYPDRLQVVYHLRSSTLNHSLVVKANILNRESPQIETVSDIWRTAEFHEREIYDLLGVVFINHPDLRRIFLEDDWVGYPLRKDYQDPFNIIEH